MKTIRQITSLVFTVFLISSNAYAATIQELASESYWLQLGHYRSAIFSNWKSEIDSPEFFLSAQGKTQPLKELQATINAFNSVDINTPEKQNPICQYPARYNWLKDKVHNNWPSVTCSEINKWKDTINPKGLTLVFPTAFMNNPSSMFGHTLLRVDAKNQNKNKELVAFAINFAAQPDSSDNAATYAFKGLVGKYPGKFTVMPYYHKVREYNDIESRDIWEYKLNLSEQETNKVLMHLWELQRATFDYYFIDENCSYQLLSLLQLARDDLDLTTQFYMQAIPSDTVAALQKHQLLQTPNYRASFGTKLHYYAQQLTNDELDIVRQVIETGVLDVPQYDLQKQAAILEVAYEWLNFEFNDKKLNRKSIAPRLRKLLFMRSKIKLPSPLSKPKSPKASPEQGHDSSRLSLGISHYKYRSSTTNISYRLAYHDLLDKSTGYIPGAKISFFDLNSSISTNGTLSIEHLYLIDAMSIAPDNRVFDSSSWNIRIGFDRQPSTLKHYGRSFIQGGYGKSYGDPNTLQAYILASAAINKTRLISGVDTTVGTELGIVWQVNDNNKMALTGNLMKAISKGHTTYNQMGLTWNWAITTNVALRSAFTHKQWITNDNQSQITLHYYF